MRKTLGLLVIATVASWLPAENASADLIASIQPVEQTVILGSSSYFDVFVTGANPAGDLVAGYTITINGVSGLNYTSVTTATSAADGYIFPGSTPMVQSTSPDVQYIELPPTGRNVVAGDEFGAGRIFFDAIQAGTYEISFRAGGGQTQTGFFREDLTDVPTSYFSGVVTVIDPAAVPEPSTTALLGLTGIVGIGVRRLRRKQSNATTAS